MKKTPLVLALAALAATATTAHALERTYDGTGQAILLPYYHAAEGESTVFTVHNHSAQAKVVRVVVAEGRNGRVALTWNLYLSPRDSWSAAIAEGPAGQPPRVLTSEESCTVPLFPAQPVLLRTDAFTQSRADNLGTDVERLQTGSIEIIETGVPVGAAAALVNARNCTGLVTRFVNGGVWDFAPNTDIAAPGGGLSAEAQVIDVADGVAYHVEPVVLDGFSAAPRHDAPGSIGSTDYRDVRFSKPVASLLAPEFEIGGAFVEAPADAVSLLLMSSAFEAGYLANASLDASTRVVLAFPTRNGYLDNLPGGDVAVGAPASGPVAGAGATAPYCIDTDWQAIDRRGVAGAVQVLPMCEQVNVIDVAQAGAGAHRFATGSEAGRVRVGLQPARNALEFRVVENDGLVTREAHGLPAVMLSLSRVVNANATPGVLASYAIPNHVVRERQQDAEF